MSELHFEAPLAKFEDTEDWPIETTKFRDKIVNSKCLLYQNNMDTFDEGYKVSVNRSMFYNGVSNENDSDLSTDEWDRKNVEKVSVINTSRYNKTADEVNELKVENKDYKPEDTMSVKQLACISMLTDNFEEQRSGSLEDLVNSFDDKISRCFYNYQESVEKLAPVQVRSQEDVMNECQMWWTITGNFGNILPIDWSKSYACKMHMPSLKLENNDENEHKWELNNDDTNNNNNSHGKDKSKEGRIGTDLNCSEEEAIANDLDMHSLILSGFNLDNTEPLKTADEIIREIDDIIQEDTSSKSSELESPSQSGIICDLYMTNNKDGFQSSLYQEKLKLLNICQLNELYLELELLIKDYSETLIAELALRDELEFQKELKNSFISLLLAVQNRRRQYHVEKKKGSRNGMKTVEPKYLTAVIPYHTDAAPLDSRALQVLIKILKAINEDSPTVPALLTDYILKVLCPT